ncbi:hypothetical protein [Erythrobacter sp. YT30]|uniref:hypothetical protein n=1 Tax=Erythrobacter sp. YT30 TaxID=1735012 RepID=UPI00076CD7CA|nr:hypothetical protein [Erythrobacter sp. YT30]KWV93047.1 hypothetical protein AUC45_02650 [Erythrobacter sp. YT30]
MNGGILALMMGGFIAFGVGAYLAATGERPTGIAAMGMGLLFQVLTLRQLRIAKAQSKARDQNDARG